MIEKAIFIAELSPEALHRLADEYHSLSKDMRAAANAKAAALSRDRASARRLLELETIPQLVRAYEAGGMTAEAAIRATAIATGVEDRCVMAWLAREKREEQERARESAKVRALELAAEGLSVREIAAAVQLPRSTVGRWVCAGTSTLMQVEEIRKALGAAREDRESISRRIESQPSAVLCSRI